MSRHVNFKCHVFKVNIENHVKGCKRAAQIESGLLWKRSHFGGGVENRILIGKRARVSLSRSQTYSIYSYAPLVPVV